MVVGGGRRGLAHVRGKRKARRLLHLAFVAPVQAVGLVFAPRPCVARFSVAVWVGRETAKFADFVAWAGVQFLHKGSHTFAVTSGPIGYGLMALAELPQGAPWTMNVASAAGFDTCMILLRSLRLAVS